MLWHVGKMRCVLVMSEVEVHGCYHVKLIVCPLGHHLALGGVWLLIRGLFCSRICSPPAITCVQE